jgi:hypothetical protein
MEVDKCMRKCHEPIGIAANRKLEAGVMRTNTSARNKQTLESRVPEIRMFQLPASRFQVDQSDWSSAGTSVDILYGIGPIRIFWATSFVSSLNCGGRLCLCVTTSAGQRMW